MSEEIDAIKRTLNSLQDAVELLQSLVLKKKRKVQLYILDLMIQVTLHLATEYRQ